MGFKENLTALRKSIGLTREELAKELNTTRGTIYQYETGKREPNFDAMRRIEHFFQVPSTILCQDNIDSTSLLLQGNYSQKNLLLLNSISDIDILLDGKDTKGKIHATEAIETFYKIATLPKIPDEYYNDYINHIGLLTSYLFAYINSFDNSHSKQAEQYKKINEELLKLQTFLHDLTKTK